MINIEPRSKFAIVRQLGNHQDSGTYYCRATIRNGRTDELIGYVALTDRGNRRFSAEWETPGDPTGLGIYFSILTEVFTDDAYTTKGKYQDEIETVFVKEQRQSFGGGSVSIDYEKIKKDIVSELKKEIPGIINIPKQEKVNLKNIENKISELSIFLSDLDIPKYDQEPVVEGLHAIINSMNDGFQKTLLEIKQAIIDKEIPETDLQPAMEIIEAMREGMKANDGKYNKLIKAIESGIPNFNAYGKKIEEFRKSMDEFINIPNPLSSALSDDDEEYERPKKELKDFSGLAQKISGQRFSNLKK